MNGNYPDNNDHMKGYFYLVTVFLKNIECN